MSVRASELSARSLVRTGGRYRSLDGRTKSYPNVVPPDCSVTKLEVIVCFTRGLLQER